MSTRYDNKTNNNKFGTCDTKHSMKVFIHHHEFEKKCQQCNEEPCITFEELYHKEGNECEMIGDVNPLLTIPEEMEKPKPKMRDIVEIVYNKHKIDSIIKKKQWK